jgi:hypothetical protein
MIAELNHAGMVLPRVTIELLPDDVLLDIFYDYKKSEGGLYHNPSSWHDCWPRAGARVRFLVTPSQLETFLHTDTACEKIAGSLAYISSRRLLPVYAKPKQGRFRQLRCRIGAS